MQVNRQYTIIFITAAAVLLCAMTALASGGDPDLQRQRAIMLARQGKYDRALSILEGLLTKKPADRKLLCDYTVVLSWAEKDEEALGVFARLEDREPLPPYVLAAAAVSARRKKNLDMAAAIYRRILEHQPGHLSARVGLYLVTAEKGDRETALTGLAELERTGPANVEVLTALAYVNRLKGDFFTEMTYHRKLLDIDPGMPFARRGMILCASTLGAPNLAMEMMEKYKDLELSLASREQIMGDYAALMVKWGEFTLQKDEKRFEETDRALQMLEENITRNSSYKYNNEAEKNIVNSALDRARFDRLVALRDRVRMHEAAKEYEKMMHDGMEVPFYAINQAADAYLYLARPKRARSLYLEVLKKDPGRFNPGFSLFYALLEAEKYRAAGRQINELARTQPQWFHLENSRVYGENPNKLLADLTAALFQAYARRLGKAGDMVREKLLIAPYNRDLRTQLAKIYLWRKWPRKSLRLFDLALAQQPKHREARIWRTFALIDRAKYNEAAEAVNELSNLFPRHKRVLQLQRYWDSLHCWHFHSETAGARGEGVELGSRDFYSDNYLFAPPMNHRFRVFLHYRNHWARFDQTARRQRWGMGLDITGRGIGARVELLRSLSGEPDYGYRFNGRWNLDDHWQISSHYAYNSLDVPLKGRLNGLKGNTAGLDLAWRISELTRLAAGVTLYDFDDGNRRRALLFTARQRLYSGPRLLLDAEAEVYASDNSLTGRVYYNPQSDASYLLSLDALHTVHRFYDFKFVHRLEAGFGAYRQEHFDAGWMGVIRYEHHWDFDDRKALLYGIGFSRRPYDGNPETALIFYITIDWRF
jgi:biofilm PGA synthesis protein PgaA